MQVPPRAAKTAAQPGMTIALSGMANLFAQSE
jgi:hypothetical protein